MRPWVFFVAVTAFALPELAQAHSPIPGIGFFYSGMLHPLRVAEQVLAMLALALLLGQGGMDRALLAIVSFGIGLLVGLPILTYGSEWTGSIAVNLLLILAAAVGLCTATAVRTTTLLQCLLAILVASCVVADSVQEGIPAGKFALATFGVLCSSFLIVVDVGWLVDSLKARWAQIGVRIVGSWICAASFMVLVLRVHATQQ
jgi:urease accessory protein